MHLTGKISVFFLSYSSLFYIATQILWSYLMLFCHVITVLIENDCIILVLQLSFYNSDLIIIFDVILPCPYCFIVCTHTRKWLYYSCFTDVFLQLRFDDHIWCYSAMSLLFLLWATLLENDCIIVVLQVSFSFTT